MKIKKDHNFTVFYTPSLIQTIKLQEGVKYIEINSGKEVEGIFEIYEYIYDEEGNRLETPFHTPCDLVIKYE